DGGIDAVVAIIRGQAFRFDLGQRRLARRHRGFGGSQRDVRRHGIGGGLFRGGDGGFGGSRGLGGGGGGVAGGGGGGGAVGGGIARGPGLDGGIRVSGDLGVGFRVAGARGSGRGGILGALGLFPGGRPLAEGGGCCGIGLGLGLVG